MGGTYSSSFLSWTCTYDTLDESGAIDPALVAACVRDGADSVTSNGDGTYTKSWTCPREPAVAEQTCGAFGGAFAYDEAFPFWACTFVPGDGSAALVESLTATCAAMSWGATDSTLGDGRQQLFCTVL